MKKGFRRRLLALGMAAALLTPAQASELPENTSESVQTEAPEKTKAPEVTEAPKPTEAPKTTEAPAGTMPAKAAEDPEPTTPAPEKTTPAPEPTTPAPEKTTPVPETTTPTPEKTTPAPEPTTPAPEVTTPAPEVTTPAPELTMPAPETTTPAPEVTTPAPESTTPAPETTTPVPEVTTPAPEGTVDPDATISPEGTVDPEATEDPSGSEQYVITAFAPLAETGSAVEAKPAKADVLAKLKTAITATLADGSTVDVSVSWDCADYDAEAEKYVFVASLTDTAYSLAEGVSMPTYVLEIVKPTQLVSGDFTCSIEEDGTLTVIAWSGSSDTVTVPEALEGKKVRGIAKSAFAKNGKLTEITVSAGVETLEDGAFSDCPKLKKVILPDSLESVGSGLFSGTDLEELCLSISLETETSDLRSYRREKEIRNEDGTVTRKEIKVSLNRDFTDYSVQKDGKWTLTGDLRIEKDHTVKVSSGCEMIIEEGVTLTVLGTLNCEGTCNNKGTIIACGGTVTGANGNVVLDHSWAGTQCSVCGEYRVVELTASYVPGAVSKVYDGTNALNIAQEDFVISGIYEADDVRIDSMEVSMEGVNAGEYTAEVAFTLGGEAAAHYSIASVSVPVTIAPKSLNDDSVTVASIGEQKYTGSAVTPAVDVTDGVLVLVQDVDYEIAYSDNIEEGTATVTISGIGNYAGERTVEFVIAREDGSLNEGAVITAFAPLAATEISVEAKPALEEVLAGLETALAATLDDGSIVSVSVTWNCPDYDSEAAQYVFTPVLAGGNFILADGVTMPAFVVRIVKPTQIVVGDFTCGVNEDDSLTIIGWSGASGNVIVPAELDGKAVRGVAKSAFAGNANLTGITVSAGVLELEAGAFADCENLSEVNLLDSLESVGSDLLSGSAPQIFRLNISAETKTDDSRSYIRTVSVQNEDGSISEEEIRISFGQDFTDYAVLDGGKWMINGPLSIEEGHTAGVSSGGMLSIGAGVRVKVFGTLSCAGSSANSGTVAACSGTVSGVGGKVVRDHSWSSGVCSICGERQTVTLTVKHATGTIKKVYDGTNALDISAKDFTLSGVRSGDDVRISAANVTFGGKNVGNYLASIKLKLSGKDAAHYSVKPLELSVVITKKKVTLIPREGQSKVYGSKDPFIRAGYRGVVSGELLTGRLSREPGENVGTYKILPGTLPEKNPNYEIVVNDATFAVTPKSLLNVTLSSISNQRYTGLPIMPSVTVTDGTKRLTEDVDYVLNYTDNVDVGSARVTVTGIGNYTGERIAGFRIIQINDSSGGGFSDDSYSGSYGGGYSSGGGYYGYSGGVSFAEDEVPAEDLIQASIALMIGGEDQGSILFDGLGEALPFVQRDEEILMPNPETGLEELSQRILHIEAQETVDDFGIVNEGDYSDPRLRVSLTLAQILRDAGYTDLYLTVGEAQLRIPLDTLYSAFVGVDSMMMVDSYEVRLWPLTEPYAENLTAALENYETVAIPVHLEMLALTETVEKDESGEYIDAMDVLSQLDGVSLAFMLAEAPDEEKHEYVILCVAAEEEVLSPEPAAAMFLQEEETFLGSHVPMLGGSYALATVKEVEA